LVSTPIKPKGKRSQKNEYYLNVLNVLKIEGCRGQKRDTGGSLYLYDPCKVQNVQNVQTFRHQPLKESRDIMSLDFLSTPLSILAETNLKY
jgi:hypothetical protein